MCVRARAHVCVRACVHTCVRALRGVNLNAPKNVSDATTPFSNVITPSLNKQEFSDATTPCSNVNTVSLHKQGSVVKCLWKVFVWGGVLVVCVCVSVSRVLFSVGVCVCV